VENGAVRIIKGNINMTDPLTISGLEAESGLPDIAGTELSLSDAVVKANMEADLCAAYEEQWRAHRMQAWADADRCLIDIERQEAAYLAWLARHGDSDPEHTLRTLRQDWAAQRRVVGAVAEM
jgi:hypothetical protein